MELGLGKLQWSPREFWSSTILEINAAARGLSSFYGMDDEESSTVAPLSTKEFDALKEKLGG